VIWKKYRQRSSGNTKKEEERNCPPRLLGQEE